MCVCVCVFVCVCMCMCVCVHKSVHIYMSVFLYMYICTVFVYVCTCVVCAQGIMTEPCPVRRAHHFDVEENEHIDKHYPRNDRTEEKPQPKRKEGWGNGE